MNIKVTYSKTSSYYRIGIKEESFENITEIHFRHRLSDQVAFESDIDHTGYNFNISDIAEFEAK